jgi:uroporphyrinogen decarboxylase
VTALGVDTQTTADQAREAAPIGMPIQGNLDPLTLVVGGKALEDAAQDVLIAFRHGPHIFNLGHGITPQALPENVAKLVSLVKGDA